MRILLDVLTPKQVLFSEALVPKLEAEGHTIYMATRRYYETNWLLHLKGIKATLVGRHGGGILHGKLTASAERIRALADIMATMDPDIAVSFSSPELARASFGLGIPHYAINDSPHAEAVAKLTIPLSSKLFTPQIIPLRAWTKFGIDRRRITRYRGLDPAAWLKDFQPSEKVLRDLGLSKDDEILVVRPEESMASYLLSEDVSARPMATAWIGDLLKDRSRLKVVLLCRYLEQIDTVKKEPLKGVIVPDWTVDAASLLSYAKAFVGYGGTMTTESALLGTYTVSSYPRPNTYVEDYLVQEGLVDKETDQGKILSLIHEALDKAVEEERIQKAKELLKAMVNPVDIIAKKISRMEKDQLSA